MRPQSHLLDTAAALPFAGQRIMLTGASGFLGWHLARQGLAAGAAIHALGRRPGPEGCLFHAADLTDPAAVAAAVGAARPAAVIHCAAPGVGFGSMDHAAMHEVAAPGTRSLLAACLGLAAPPLVVLVGSGFEYAPSAAPIGEDWPTEPPPASYGAAKAAAARIAGEFADRLPLAMLRPFHIYGAGEAERRLGPFVIGEARGKRPVALTGCAQQRDFLHVDDCAAMLWEALARLPHRPGLLVRNIGSGRPIALRRFVEAVADALARRGIAAHCQFGALPYREGEPMVSLPDTSRWTAEGRRSARISLEDGVADLVRAELAQCA